MLLGFLGSFLVIAVFPSAGEQATLSGQIVAEPIWLPEVLMGILLGGIAYRRLPTKLAFYVGVPPAVLLFSSAWHWQQTMAIYDSTWDTYFGKGCAGSECLYELLLTAPFYTSLAYTVGALASRLNRSGLKSGITST
jgi:hypothetical protein